LTTNNIRHIQNILSPDDQHSPLLDLEESKNEPQSAALAEQSMAEQLGMLEISLPINAEAFDLSPERAHD
jgi:hypothetical protein